MDISSLEIIEWLKAHKFWLFALAPFVLGYIVLKIRG